MYLLGLLFSLSPPPAAPAAFPLTTGCNLAPNSAFERGTATTVDQWQFDWLPGGSMAVVRHDQATGNWVQSGARSVRIQVPAPGPHNLYTEEPGRSLQPGSPWPGSQDRDSQDGRGRALALLCRSRRALPG